MILALALLVVGCDRAAPDAAGGGGAALEETARLRGLVSDPGAASPVGVFRTDSDRVCVQPAGGGLTIGASVDYGEGQRCVAHGTASGRGQLDVDFGGGCRFRARADADRIVFPAVLPDACEAACVGRASLAAISAPRLSDSAAEAAQLRGADGKLLCSN